MLTRVLNCRRLWYNIKADFLGLTKEINGVENTAVDLSKKLAFGLALRGVVKSTGLVAKTVHPVVSTMLPKANNKLRNFLQVWCSIKNEFYNGEAGLQFSINSTDDEQSCLTLRVCHQHKFLSWLMSYQCQQAESIL